MPNGMAYGVSHVTRHTSGGAIVLEGAAAMISYGASIYSSSCIVALLLSSDRPKEIRVRWL
jgi:hypothetical protein